MKKLAALLMTLLLVTSPLQGVSAGPAIALLALWGLALLRRPCTPHRAALVLALNYCYWVVRLFSSGIPWHMLASYGFIRWQSRMFIAFLPFFVSSTPHLVGSIKLSRRLLWLFLLASVSVVLFGAGQLLLELPSPSGRSVLGYVEFEGGPIVHKFGEKWFFGFHRSHPAAGAFFLLPTLLSLTLSLFWRTNLRARLALLGIFALSFWAIVFTKTRAAYVAFAVAFLLILVWYGSKKIKGLWAWNSAPARPLLAVVLIILVVPFLVPGGLARMGIVPSRPEVLTKPSLTQTERLPSHSLATDTVADRFLYWSVAFRMFHAQPLVGVGLGRFTTLFSAEYGNRVRAPSPYPEAYHAHNSYLQILAELGVVGLLLFGFFWTVTLKALLSRLQDPGRGSFEGAFILGVILSIVAEFVIGIFDDNLRSPAVMLPLSLLMGLALAVPVDDEGEFRDMTPASLPRSACKPD